MKKSEDLALGNPIKFYNDTITLRFSERDHIYYRVDPEGLVPLDGVTNTCGIIDKSLYLIPWGVKMAAEKLLATMPHTADIAGDFTDSLPWPQFVELVNEAKKAHKEKLVDAGEVGSKAHTLIEHLIKEAIRFNKGVIPIGAKTEVEGPEDDERVANCVNAAISWMNQHNVKWLKTEHKVYSRKYEYAGTMDGLAEVDGTLSVVDWKTSNNLRTEYFLQTASYLYAHSEEFGTVIPDRWILRLGKEKGDFEPWHVGPETMAEDMEAFILCLQLRRTYGSIEKRIADNKKQQTTAKKAKKALGIA